MRPDILNEKVLSAIVEFKTALSRVDHFIDTVERVAGELPTIVALGSCSGLRRATAEARSKT